SQRFVVGEKLFEHAFRRHKVVVVIFDSLVSRNFSDGMQRASIQLAGALSNRVGHREYLSGLLIQQQMVVTEIRAVHVPVKILSLDVNRKDVREKTLQL